MVKGDVTMMPFVFPVQGRSCVLQQGCMLPLIWLCFPFHNVGPCLLVTAKVQPMLNPPLKRGWASGMIQRCTLAQRRWGC